MFSSELAPQAFSHLSMLPVFFISHLVSLFLSLPKSLHIAHFLYSLHLFLKPALSTAHQRL